MTWPNRFGLEDRPGTEWCPSRLVWLRLPGSAFTTLHALGQVDWPTGPWFLSPPALEARRNGTWGPPEGELPPIDAIRTENGERLLLGRTLVVMTEYPLATLRWYSAELGLDRDAERILSEAIYRTAFPEIERLYDRIRSLEHELAAVQVQGARER